MPTDKWDDERIEDLLSDFPSIRDERPKEQVYNRILKENPMHRKQKRWMPYLIAVLAFITFGVLVTSLINSNSMDSARNEHSEDSANHSAAVEESAGNEQVDSGAMEKAEPEEAAEFSIMQADEPSAPSVYPENMAGYTLFEIGLTENAYVIPAAFLIPDDQISEDFGVENPDRVDLYNRYAAEIDEEALGFDDYHPYAGTLEKTADGMKHSLPAEHPYDLASAAIGVYTESITETFEGIGAISVLDENGQKAEFSQVGPVEPFSASVENMAYFSVNNSLGESFLAPAYGMPFNSAEEAIQAMKNSPSDFQQSVIPEDIAYTVSETEDLVEIEFEKPVDFESMEETSARHMIEGMLLSADSFGKNVKFNNTGTEQWTSFDFTEEIEAPLAVNRLEWNGK